MCNSHFLSKLRDLAQNLWVPGYRALLMSIPGSSVQLEGIFNFPPIPVGNKTEEGIRISNPIGSPPFQWKHCNENTGKVSEELWVGLQWGESLLCTLPCLTGVERINVLQPTVIRPIGWKLSGIAVGSQCACHKITGNVWVDSWVGLQFLVGWLCWGLTSQSTIFQSCRGGAIASWVINQYFRGVKCLAQGHNTAEVGLEPRTSRSGVRHSTTEPPRSPGIAVGKSLPHRDGWDKKKALELFCKPKNDTTTMF